MSRKTAQQIYEETRGSRRKVVGTYLASDCKLHDKRKIKVRLEYLRQKIRDENISYGEIAELQSLAQHIEDGDVELLQWAGVPEHAN